MMDEREKRESIGKKQSSAYLDSLEEKIIAVMEDLPDLEDSAPSEVKEEEKREDLTEVGEEMRQVLLEAELEEESKEEPGDESKEMQVVSEISEASTSESMIDGMEDGEPKAAAADTEDRAVSAEETEETEAESAEETTVEATETEDQTTGEEVPESLRRSEEVQNGKEGSKNFAASIDGNEQTAKDQSSEDQTPNVQTPKEPNFWQKLDQKVRRRIMIGGGVALVLLILFYIVHAGKFDTRYLAGTSINNMEVGNMTVEEVQQALKPEVESYELTLTLRNEQEEVISGEAIDLTYTPGEELQEILDSQNSYAWITGVLGMKREYEAVIPVTYSRSKLMDLITAFEALQEENIVEPANATMALDETNHFVVVPEVYGSKVDRVLLNETVEEGISLLTTTIDLTQTEGIYDNPEVLSDNEELLSAVDTANTFLNTEVTYVNQENEEILKIGAETTKDWLTQDPDTQLYYVDEASLQSNIEAYVTKWAEEDDNYGYFRVFHSTNYGDVKVETSSLHGHKLNREQIVSEISEAVGSRTPATYQISYSEYVDDPDKYLGGTYVEVDIDAQEVYIFHDYEYAYSTSTVTGNEYNTPTPNGIYSIYYRERNAQLTGEMTADGTPSYVSYVSYWMAFYEGYGLHDATWRSSFGGSIYTYNGSHGCVNLPYNAAKTIWELTDYGMPVVVFRESESY